MTEQFRYLFTPLKIGAMTVPNRIFLPGHSNRFFGYDALPTDRALNYYSARAKGGAGLIITSVHHVLPLTSAAPPGPIHDDGAIETFQRIAATIHQYGTKIMAQLCHMGRGNSPRVHGGAAWAPSPIVARELLPGPAETPHEMDIDEIRQVVEAFGSMARRMRLAGLDGVEIQALFGFLIPQFWSPLSNLRSDAYGGNQENRFRFASEVIDSVRAAVGTDFVVGIRITGDEFVDGGLTLDDMKVIATKLEATGKLDYISVCAGTQLAVHIPSMYFPLGVYAYLCAGIKENVNLPVFCTGRINDPVLAENILAEGHADMTGMVRGLICDPELPNKAREGKLEEIRRCLGCCECMSPYFFVPLSCTFNQEAGREREFAIVPAATKKKVMVIGGGAAGLETARVAALRGHQVSLYEKEGDLGGQVNVAAKAPGRVDFTEVISYYTYQMRHLGVDVHLNNEVTAGMVEKGNFDAVVIATGSRSFIPTLPGSDQVNILEVRDVLNEKGEVGENVVLIAGEHHMQGLSTAEFLVDRGKKVEILTDAFYAGAQVDPCSLEAIYRRLLSKGVTITPLTSVKEIQRNGIVVFNVITNDEKLIEGVDTIVVSMGGKADDALYRSLKGKVKELYAVGHCLSPRRLRDSILDGARVGRLL